jgi:hypothetical protein
LNVLKLISENAASLGMADAVSKIAKNRSVQNIVGNALRNIGMNQTSARKDQILQLKYET